MPSAQSSAQRGDCVKEDTINEETSAEVIKAKPTQSASPSNRTSTIQFFAGGIAAIILIALGVGGTLLYQYFEAKNNPLTAHTVLKDDGNALTTATETAISNVASKVSPSVVSILTKLEDPTSYWTTDVQEAAGSGFIVGGDGYIVTNKHVVSDASEVQVILVDGTTYSNVKVLGTDPLNDLAFLKIDGVKGLPAIQLGDSSTVKIGQSVIAIGNSLGEYQNTVTSGIISGLGRPLVAQDQGGGSPEALNDLIQTDAAINPGNSGGPLLNSAGQVIGINTAIAADAEGIGFSIPINSAKGILKGVLAGKGVQRGYLGVRYIPVNAAVAKEYKLSVKQGAYLDGSASSPAVVSGSPAAKAGLKAGDIITKVNGVSVGTQGGVSSLVAEYAPGDTIELTVVRGDRTLTIKVTLTAYS